MTDAHDASGKLLPDDKRMTPFGKWLRSTSLDELPGGVAHFYGENELRRTAAAACARHDFYDR